MDASQIPNRVWDAKRFRRTFILLLSNIRLDIWIRKLSLAANSEFYLWTPIANALDAYRRRLIADENAFYEHIWRLIHIEEALIVTLGAAIATRLMENWLDDPDRQAELNELRSIVIGIAPTGSDSNGTVVIEWVRSLSVDTSGDF